jgi:hypothetical protein
MKEKPLSALFGLVGAFSCILVPMPCTYLPRGTDMQCRKENVMNFDYCIDHLNTPRGAQHMLDRVASRQVVTQEAIEKKISKVQELEPKDYQTSALEKMNDALDRVLEWEEGIRIMLSRVDPSEWRFTNRAGEEQIRSEVTLYERAQDRTTRVLTQVSKMAIQEKLVSLGKAQTELIIRIIMSVITDLELPEDKFAKAKYLILQQLNKEANLSPRVNDEVQRELTSVEGEIV